jgi:hypothetical protein
MISPSELSQFIAQTYAQADSKLPKGFVPERVVVPKAYTVPFTAMAFGTTQSQQLQIGANGDFFMTRMIFNVLDPGITPATAIPQLSIQITDSGSDEQFFNAPVLITDIFVYMILYNAKNDLPYPRVVTGRSNLTVTITSLETATSWTPYITFEGALVKTFS